MIPARGKTAAVFLLGLIIGAAAGSWGQRVMFHRMMQRGPDPKRMVERLSHDLGLDDKQKAAVGAILDAKHDDVEAIKKDTFTRLENIRADADGQISKLLTPEQAARFDKIRRAHKMHLNWEPPAGFPPPSPDGAR